MPASATITAMPLLFAGDVVTVDPARFSGQAGVEFVVHNPKRSNASIKVKGQPLSRGFNVDMSALIKTGETCIADLAAANTASREAAAKVTAARVAVTPKTGAVVRLNRKFSTYAAADLMVVTKVNDTTVSLSRLGGDQPGERGMRIDPRGVTVVDLATILA